MGYLKKILLAFILLNQYSDIDAQSIGCIDSLNLNKFAPSFFKSYGNDPSTRDFYTLQRDKADNIYTSGSTSFGSLFSTYSSIIKFNAKNELVWYKNYRPFGPQPWTGFTGYGFLTGIDDTANLIFSNFIGNPVNSSSSWTQITKVDSAGNFKWSKRYSRADNPNLSGGLGMPIVDKDGSLFCRGGFVDDLYQSQVVTAIDPSGTIKWVKKYYQTGILKYHLLGVSLVSQNANALILVHSFYYNSDDYFDPAAKFAVQFVKINKADGGILQQKSFMYFSDAGGTNYTKCYVKKINYSPSTNLFLLSSWSYLNVSAPHNQILSLIDSNFNPVKSVFYLSNLTESNPAAKRSISTENISTYFYPDNNPSRLSYVALDNNLEIATQKIINLTNLGFPSYPFNGDVGYKKNGILNFQLGTLASIVTNSLYLFDHSLFYNGISSCLGEDTILYTKTPVYTLPVANETMYEVDTIPVSVTDLVPNNMPPLDFTLPKTEICKELSICDTIKLFGTQYHCLSSPLDSFKIIRNPLCKRVTNWQVDTNYIKILSQSDTSLHVQYLLPYRGSIKVGFGGCSLTDSIPIEVYAAQTGVNLGNDTMHCPGKTITLRAGNHFKLYLWQDGSSKDSLVAAQPGIYHITVTDSCGNIFKDTLWINPMDVVLTTDHSQPICFKDTVTFNLPNQLYNYSWLPITNSSLQNYTWKLFPPATTTYSISGERMPGCIISDTVLITVKPNCLPDHIYFPTAFTPNGDGLNDTYKPGINGLLALYEFIIYNRYGQLVFRSTTPRQGWDGSYKDNPQDPAGRKPLSGSYAWSCKYQFAGRPIEQEQGTFVLIR